MSSKLYVGNLSYQLEEDSLANVFGEFGEVKSAKIIMDRETGRSKGFGFVEMGDEEQATSAIEGLDGKEVEGRNLRVSVAQDKRPNNRRPSGGGFRGDRFNS